MTIRPEFGDLLWLTMAAGWFVTIGVDIGRRQKAGAVLLNLGANDGRGVYMLLGLLVEAGALYAMFFLGGRILFFSVFALGFGFFLIMDSQRRIEIREAGVFGRDRLIQWQEISGYEISPIGTLSLKSQSKKLTFLCDLRPEIRPEVARILALECSRPLQPGAVLIQ
jgi:hypothetical protein